MHQQARFARSLQGYQSSEVHNDYHFVGAVAFGVAALTLLTQFSWQTMIAAAAGSIAAFAQHDCYYVYASRHGIAITANSINTPLLSKFGG